MFVNAPPTYNLLLVTYNEKTELFALGFQAVGAPVIGLTATILFLDCPAIAVKSPPR